MASDNLTPEFLIAGSSPSSSSSNSVNPIASLGALQTLAGATAGLNVGSLAGNGRLSSGYFYKLTQYKSTNRIIALVQEKLEIIMGLCHI